MSQKSSNQLLLFEWSKEDDLKLLDGILQCGFDNWIDISNYTGRPPKECQNRYLTRFIEEPQEPELKSLANKLETIRNGDKLCTHNCYLDVKRNLDYYDYTKYLSIENYLKNLLNIESQINGGLSPRNEIKFSTKKRRFNNGMFPIPGHNPQRSDFEVEYDDRAEYVLGLLHEPIDAVKFHNESDNQFFEEMQAAMGRIYNFRLDQRMRVKKIIRNHGLIDKKKNFDMIQRFKIPCGGRNVTPLLYFLKFISGPELDYLYESLMYQAELKTSLQTYMSYRSRGIKYLGGIKIYENLNRTRMKHKAEFSPTSILQYIEDWGVRQMKKTSLPLVLNSLPGYHLLDEDEKDLCSNARIVPETYYNFKQLLISECKRHNGLRLVQARALIKIDVNKTRKMYDYLISTGLIWLPKNEEKQKC